MRVDIIFTALSNLVSPLLLIDHHGNTLKFIVYISSFLLLLNITCIVASFKGSRAYTLLVSVSSCIFLLITTFFKLNIFYD